MSGNVIGYARVSTRDNPWILKWMHSWLQGPCVYFRSTPPAPPSQGALEGMLGLPAARQCFDSC